MRYVILLLFLLASCCGPPADSDTSVDQMQKMIPSYDLECSNFEKKHAQIFLFLIERAIEKDKDPFDALVWIERKIEVRTYNNLRTSDLSEESLKNFIIWLSKNRDRVDNCSPKLDKSLFKEKFRKEEQKSKEKPRETKEDIF